MKIKFTTLLLLFFLMLFFSCKKNQSPIEDTNQTSIIMAVDNYVKQVMERQGIPGSAVAIIRNDTVIHRKNYGLANIEHNVPVSDATIFRVYSITKLFITVGVFQLIEQNKLNLEDKISKYLVDLPERWKEVKIKHLITHSSGLPDFKFLSNYNDLSKEEVKEQLFIKDLIYQTGERYEYNQTNYWFLHEIIEKVSEKSLAEFIIGNQFTKETRNAFFSSDSRDIIPNRVTLYFPFTTGKLTIEHPYGGAYNWATNGMNLTLNQFIEWSKRLDNNMLLKKETKQSMWEEFPFESDEKTFTLGWDKFKSDEEISYGFTGNITNVYRLFPEQNLSIIFISNGMNTIFDVDDVADHLAFLVDKKLKKSEIYIYEKLLQASNVNDNNQFENACQQIKKEYGNEINIEDQINTIGYFHLRKEQYEKAIQIFTINNHEYPTSWNTFDSLGEAYEMSGNTKKAILYYQKAIELNQTNESDNNSRLGIKISELEKMKL